MDSLDLDGWHDFAAATAGVAGALAGLIIVAVSVNVKQIIEGSALPARAGATIASIAVILVSAMAMLIPTQPALWLGLEIVGFTVVALLFQADAAVRILRSHDSGLTLGRKIGTIVLGVGQFSGLLIGGALIMSGDASGVFHVAAGFIAIFIVAIVNAWVLMVEILR
ncbi:MAG: hypothetical protein Q7T55_15930 [Solirubrobacteraceae bacterium]|nr:hypothetical protein [Solirubrobacteraceae bacterium]